jgi:hypothetical protein
MAVVVALASVALFSSSALAKETIAAPEKCPVPAGADPSLGDVDVRERAHFIQEHLRRDAANARMWGLGWTATSLATGAAGLTLGLLESDRDKRTGSFIWAGTSLIIPAKVLFFPFHVMGDSRELDASDPRELGTCAGLARAEASLVRDAEQEEGGTAWYSHAIAIGFNVALGAILGYALDDWGNNAAAAGIGIALSELQILTQPMGAVRARTRYLTGNLAAPDEASGVGRLTIAPIAQPRTYGFSLGVTF